MAKIAAWHARQDDGGIGGGSIGEGPISGTEERVYHDRDDCADALAIPEDQRAPGEGGYDRCPACAALG